MKKVTSILVYTLLTIISFCSCTSSGKLTDAKFPYKFTYIGEPGVILTNDGQIIYSKKTGLKHPNFDKLIYNGLPLNVGSYQVTASITDRKYLEYKNKIKFSILKYIPYLLSIFLTVFILKIKRDEIITLPEEFKQNY